MMNLGEESTAKVISLDIKYFAVYDGAVSAFKGIVGTDGTNIAHLSRSQRLDEALQHYLSLMQEGLYVKVDDTDYFLLTSLKDNIERLKYKGEFIVSKIHSERGKLEKVLQDEYTKRQSC